MELQFQSVPVSCLQTLMSQRRTVEQTQEVRLNETMPDIGKVIGVWGQVLLRSKQWNNDSIGLSAGVMAQVLYMPDEEDAPQAVEVWIPFQERFDLPPYDGREGKICCKCLLCDVDARYTSARKLIVRVNVEIFAQVFVNTEIPICQPEQIPEDIQLLKNAYPMLLPVETGEKAFELEEILELPSGMPVPGKIVSCRIYPKVQEQKLLTDKVIFRGSVCARLVYLGEDGQLYGYDFTVPFSQFAELEREYEPGSTVRMDILPTSVEVEKNDEELKLQMGLVGQYTVICREMITLVEDAYSPQRQVDSRTQPLELPSILEEQEVTINAQQNLPAEGIRMADIIFYPSLRIGKDNGNSIVQMNGQFQMLYYDLEGNLNSTNGRWEHTYTVPGDENTAMHLWLSPEPAQGNVNASGGSGQCGLNLQILAESADPMEMVCGLSVGDLLELQPNRPSLILRKAGQDDLWHIAKQTGSTVEAIRRANNLETDPEENRMLLIPVV